MNDRTLQDYLSITRAFINAKSRGQLRIPEELKIELVEALIDFTKTHKIQFHFVEATAERTELFAWAGAIAGAAIGYSIGNLPGAVVGGAIGYVVGTITAEVRITITPVSSGDICLDISSI